MGAVAGRVEHVPRRRDDVLAVVRPAGHREHHGGAGLQPRVAEGDAFGLRVRARQRLGAGARRRVGHALLGHRAVDDGVRRDVEGLSQLGRADRCARLTGGRLGPADHRRLAFMSQPRTTTSGTWSDALSRGRSDTRLVPRVSCSRSAGLVRRPRPRPGRPAPAPVRRQCSLAALRPRPRGRSPGRGPSGSPSRSTLSCATCSCVGPSSSTVPTCSPARRATWRTTSRVRHVVVRRGTPAAAQTVRRVVPTDHGDAAPGTEVVLEGRDLDRVAELLQPALAGAAALDREDAADVDAAAAQHVVVVVAQPQLDEVRAVQRRVDDDPLDQELDLLPQRRAVDGHQRPVAVLLRTRRR